MKKSTKTLIAVAALIVLAVALFFYFYSSRANEVSLDAFYEKSGLYLVSTSDTEEIAQIEAAGNVIRYRDEKGCYVIVDKHEITRIVINGYTLNGYVGNSLKYKANYARSGSADTEILNAIAASNGVAIEYTDPNANSAWTSIVFPLLLVGIAIVIAVMFVRQIGNSNRGAMDFGKTKAQVITNVKVRFSDVAGAEEEKTELQEIVEFLKSPKKFSDLGARIPRGVLLVGNPGTGKTLFAKAVAGEANVPFFSISGSDFVEMYVGVGASRVRDLFNTAKKSQPCIIFIDEIDAVGRQRGAGLGGGNDEREQTLNQLLVQMDGFETNEGIIVMAATNRADILDPALTRPGRFDRQVYVNMPDVRGREAILRVHSRNKPLESNVSFKILARMTAGFSGADLANLLNEAAILAARSGRTSISNSDLYEGINKVLIGPQKKSRVVTETDRRITAYHESGHAILAKLLPHCDPVHEVSIIPRGMAAGYTMTRPDNDDGHLTKATLTDDIVMTLGGRVAEELIIKDISAGASNDILVITRKARKMVSEWGMSDVIGPVSYGNGEEIFVGRDYQTRSNYSEEKAKAIDNEVESIIKKAYATATELLKSNKNLLDTMARLLIECDTIYSDEVDMVMQGKTVEEIEAYMKNKDTQGLSNPLSKNTSESTLKSETEKPEDNKDSNDTERKFH